MSTAPFERVGDRERDEAAQALSGHASAGRLDSAELEERLERALRARTADELDALFADLPTTRSPAGGAPRRATRWPPASLAVAVLVLATLASLAAGHPVPPLWLLAFVLWCRAGRRVGPRRLAP